MFQARQIIDQVFERLQEDPENCHCIDCNAEFPVFISISHGTFLCPLCVNYHNQLGGISNTKSILSNDWSVPELKKLVVSGGNSALKEFISHYELTDFPIETKYKTKALSVYRNMLNEIAEGRSFEEELPPINIGKEPDDYINPQGWFKDLFKKSKTFGMEALERLECFKEKTKNKVEGMRIISRFKSSSLSLRTSQAIEHIAGDVKIGLITGSKVIKNETLALLKELENLIGCKTKNL